MATKKKQKKRSNWDKITGGILIVGAIGLYYTAPNRIVDYSAIVIGLLGVSMLNAKVADQLKKLVKMVTDLLPFGKKDGT